MSNGNFSLGEWTQIVLALRDRVVALEQADQDNAGVLADLTASRAGLSRAIPFLASAMQPRQSK